MPPLNTLGPWKFLWFHGTPHIMEDMVQAITRPGFDGATFWRMGKPSEPFQLGSCVDAPDYLTAQMWALQYPELKGKGPVELVWDDISLVQQAKTIFQVLDVKIVACHALARAIGGLYPPSLGWLEAQWTLVATPRVTDPGDSTTVVI